MGELEPFKVNCDDVTDLYGVPQLAAEIQKVMLELKTP